MATTPEGGASIGDLLRQLIEDTGHLFRTELRLARAEVKANIAGMMGGVGAVAAGGMLLLAALLVLLGGLVAFLAPHVGAGWGAIIVAAGCAVIGGVLVAVGAGKVRAANFAPDRSLESLRQNVETLKGN